MKNGTGNVAHKLFLIVMTNLHGNMSCQILLCSSRARPLHLHSFIRSQPLLAVAAAAAAAAHACRNYYHSCLLLLNMQTLTGPFPSALLPLPQRLCNLYIV